MIDLQQRIEEIEIKAAESALLAELATDPDVRTYNVRLAHELREFADKLSQQLCDAA